MKASEGVDRQTVQRLLFARLLVQTKRALTRDEVIKSVAQALSSTLSASAAEKVVREELERNETSGWVADVAAASHGKGGANGGSPSKGARPRGKSNGRARKLASRLALTPKAQALAFALFGGEAMPAVRSWDHGQQLAALSQIGRAVAAEKTLHVDALAAVILAERTGAPPELERVSAVVDYLSWRELGVETTAAFEVDAVQRYLLRGIVPHDVRVNQTTWRRMLAMKVAGADSPDMKGLVRALLAFAPKSRGRTMRAQPAAAKSRTRRGGSTSREQPARQTSGAQRLQRAPARKSARSARDVQPTREMKPAQPRAATRNGTSPVANDNAPRTTVQPSLADFAAAVREAARLPAVARFHDDRAFIGSVWEQMRVRGLLGSMSLDEFKARLIAAHRDGLLRITRADLVAAMDPNELERSEARYQNATFHFVALEAGGSR